MERARRGEEPTLIEAVTYRMGPHTAADDPGKYMSSEEIKLFEKHRPNTGYVNKELKPRKIGYLSLSFDHRFIEGAYATRFLLAVKRYLENSAIL